VWRDFDGLADHGRGACARGRRPLGALKRVALRDAAPALALQGVAMGAARRFRSSEGAPATFRACFRSERGRGSAERRRTRGISRSGASSRVEVGRLRTVLRTLADVSATKRGFALAPRRADEVVVLARPVEEEHGAVLAFLADGESWSSSALALALGTSQLTVQRALDALAAAGKVQPFGRGRARRWMTPPVPGFTTTLLLPAPLPGD